jgi:diguanylate cyclase (GGDEF)-like protein
LAGALQAAGLSVSAEGAWSRAAGADALVVSLAAAQAVDAAVFAQAAFDSALVVLVPGGEAIEHEATLLRQGAEAIASPDDAAALARAVRHAIVRKQLEHAARTVFATDLATGLPHQAQLLEHMTQLLALREREPAPMVLLVLRIEGFAQAASRLGVEAGNVLRRKVAVRLRSLLRASDVVAAVGPDAFGVLLGHLEHQGDGERVATKLVRALQQPVLVAGQPCAVGASVGMSLVPEHGRDAQALLQRAMAQAGSLATAGAVALAVQPRAAPASAANDDTR